MMGVGLLCVASRWTSINMVQVICILHQTTAVGRNISVRKFAYQGETC